MKKVINKKNRELTYTLTDGTTLRLAPKGKSGAIEDKLISQQIFTAEKAGSIRLNKVVEKKSKNDDNNNNVQNGGNSNGD